MATLVSTDATSALEQDRRRLRRRRQRAVAIFVSIIVVLLVLGDVYAANYQPMMSNHRVSDYGVRVLDANGSLARWHHSPGPSSQPVWREPRGTFSVQLVATIFNDGPFPITVNSVGAPDPSDTHVRVFFDTYGAKGFSGGSAFHPVTIPGHNEQTVAIHWRQACRVGLPSQIVFTQQVPVTFTFLGYRHTVPIYTSPYDLQLRTHC